jgi:hypothetical protein
MASMHQVLQVQQRFGDDQDKLASLAPNFYKVNNGQAGPSVTFQVEAGGKEAFVLIKAMTLIKLGLRFC